MEKLPQTIIYDSVAPEHRQLTRQLMDLLCELNRDFHDFRGHVELKPAAYTDSLKLSLPEVEGLMQRLRLTHYTPAELLELGFDFTDILVNPCHAIDVEFPDRKLIFLTGLDIYLDPLQANMQYV